MGRREHLDDVDAVVGEQQKPDTPVCSFTSIV